MVPRPPHEFMDIIGLWRLDEASRRHAEVRGPLAAWLREIQSSDWPTPVAIRSRFRSADVLPGSRGIFDIKGNAYRLVARVDYRDQVLQVLWFGTHAEYDRLRGSL